VEKMAKVIVRTETWNTRDGKIIKAVARDASGTFLGATNQTAGIKTGKVVRPRVTLVGSK
jgi:hypothetical protein